MYREFWVIFLQCKSRQILRWSNTASIVEALGWCQWSAVQNAHYKKLLVAAHKITSWRWAPGSAQRKTGKSWILCQKFMLNSPPGLVVNTWLFHIIERLLSISPSAKDLYNNCSEVNHQYTLMPYVVQRRTTYENIMVDKLSFKQAAQTENEHLQSAFGCRALLDWDEVVFSALPATRSLSASTMIIRKVLHDSICIISWDRLNTHQMMIRINDYLL